MMRKQRGYEKCRWSYIRQSVSFSLLNDTVFPWLRSLESRVGPAQNDNTTLGRISGRLSDAYFILDVNKTDTLKRSVGLIDELFYDLVVPFIFFLSDYIFTSNLRWSTLSVLYSLDLM